jgi:ferredoxin
MRVRIDPERCSGHGRCYEVSPAVFTDDERGYGVVREEELDPGLLEDARRAVATCPERAISISDD